MLELIYYGLFLLLYVFGAWLLFSSGQKIFSNTESTACESSNNEITPLSSDFQFDENNSDLQLDRQLDEEDEQVEHSGIMEDVLQEVLSEQPTPFEHIFVRYVERCNTLERERRLDKPRVRDRVKVYLREMADSGKLKRVMKGREYFYVVAERGDGEVIGDSEHMGVFQANIQVKR
jgi:hypothetical protein